MKKLTILALVLVLLSACSGPPQEKIIPAVSSKTNKCVKARIARRQGFGGAGIDRYVTVDSAYNIHMFKVKDDGTITEIEAGDE